MSPHQDHPESPSESLLRVGRELLDASRQTLRDLDEMLDDVAADVVGDGDPAPAPEAP